MLGLLSVIGEGVELAFFAHTLRGSNSYASKEEARMLNYDLTPAD